MNSSMKWLAALLFISIVANIYFVGGYFGHKNDVLRHLIKSQESRPENRSRFSMRQLTHGLPEHVRKQIGAAIRQERESLHAMSKEQIKLRKEAIDLLSAEEIDVVALKKVFEQQRMISSEIQVPAHEALLKILPTVDQKTRQEMVQKMRNVMREERKHRKRKKPHSQNNEEEQSSSKE